MSLSEVPNITDLLVNLGVLLLEVFFILSGTFQEYFQVVSCLVIVS